MELLCEYALAAADEISRLPNGDRIARESIEQDLEWAIASSALRAEFDLLLASWREQITTEREGVVRELVAACSTWRAKMPVRVLVPGVVGDVISFCAEHHVSEALRAAVEPGHARSGQLGGDTHPQIRRLVLDHLAHLATSLDDAVARPAISALVQLTRYTETALDAALRLPVHRLRDDDITMLMDALERHEDSLAHDGVAIPWCDDLLRIPVVLRSALWQAIDAKA